MSCFSSLISPDSCHWSSFCNCLGPARRLWTAEFARLQELLKFAFYSCRWSIFSPWSSYAYRVVAWLDCEFMYFNFRQNFMLKLRRAILTVSKRATSRCFLAELPPNSGRCTIDSSIFHLINRLRFLSERNYRSSSAPRRADMNLSPD